MKNNEELAMIQDLARLMVVKFDAIERRLDQLDHRIDHQDLKLLEAGAQIVDKSVQHEERILSSMHRLEQEVQNLYGQLPG